LRDLDTYDFTVLPQLSKPKILELARGEWIERKYNCCLIGSHGTGKTHLATSIAVEACGQGKRVQFARVTALVTQLLEAREERQLSRLRDQLSKLHLLVLDELGYVPASKVGA
jgi:DNA replication protein DnaC